jgi:hypothetical protein
MQPGSHGRAGRKYIFVGPTLHRGLAAKLTFELDDFVLLPPAKRGDMQRLVGSGATPGVVAIVDGYFHLHNLAIGHAELRMAIAAGWHVWGLSSMGAIRAAEMRDLGMRGFGAVYRRYADDPRFRDDEVALLHQPDPPYRTFSEPLVHIRAWLDAMVTAGDLAADRRHEILATLMPMWFGDRTHDFLRACVGASAAKWVDRLEDFQLKSRDLGDFLHLRPWQGTPAGGSP